MTAAVKAATVYFRANWTWLPGQASTIFKADGLFIVRIEESDGKLGLLWWDSASGGITRHASAIGNEIDATYAVVADEENNRWEIWRNGVKLFLTRGGLSATTRFPVPAIGIGNTDGVHVNESLNGTLNYCHVYLEAHSQQRLLEEMHSPWQVYQDRSIWVPVSAGGGVTIPTLSAATVTEITATSARPRVTTTAASAGTMYAVIYPDGSGPPTAAQIIAGYSGTAVWAGSTAAPTAAGTFDWPTTATGLTGGTSYRIAFAWSNGSDTSNVTSSARFETLAAATYNLTASLAATVQAARLAAVSVAAALQSQRNATAAAAAAVQQLRTGSVSATAALRSARFATAAASAALNVRRVSTSSAAAALRSTRSAQAALDAYLQSGSSLSAGLQAAIRAQRAASVTASVALQRGGVAQLSAAAALQRLRQASVALSAYVSAATAINAAASAALQARRTGSAGLSVYVVTDEPPRPEEPNDSAFYRRAARDVLNGRVKADGNDVMLRIGARKRLRGRY